MKKSALKRSVAVLLAVFPAMAALAADTPPTGKYIGQYQFQINAPKEIDTTAPDFPQDKLWSWAAAPPFYFFKTADGTEVNRPAYSVQPAFWEWDFDSKVVRVAPTLAWAMESLIVGPTPRGKNYVHDAARARTPNPEETPESDLTASLILNSDGTYTVDFALELLSTPFGNRFVALPSRYSVTRTAGNTIRIDPLPATTNAEHDYLVKLNEGIPGTLTSQTLPFVVAPTFYGPVLYANTADDCNKDGLTNAEARVLGLDPCNYTVDKNAVIGPYAFYPKDSNRNGVFDVWENFLAVDVNKSSTDGTETIMKHPVLETYYRMQRRVNGIHLGNGEFINLVNDRGDYFHGSSEENDYKLNANAAGNGVRASLGGNYGLDLPDDYLETLPKTHPDTGKPLDWSMGRILIRTTLGDNSFIRLSKYKSIRNTLLVADDPTSYGSPAYAQAQVDATMTQIAALDPAAANYATRKASLERLLQLNETALLRAQTILQWALQDEPWLAQYVAGEGGRLFGADVLSRGLATLPGGQADEANNINYVGEKDLKTDARVIHSDGLDNGLNALDKYTVVKLEFPAGVPDGLVIRKVYLGKLPGQESAPNSVPVQQEVPYRRINDRQVELLVLDSLTGASKTGWPSYSERASSITDGDAILDGESYDRPVVGSAVGVHTAFFVIGHTEQGRKVEYDYSGGAGPEPETPPASNPEIPPTTKSGGGALGGELAGLLGLALLALRRRIGARLNGWVMRLGA